MEFYTDDLKSRNEQKTKYITKIKKYMKSLNTYKVEFSKAIETLAQLCVDMDSARLQFEEDGAGFCRKHTNKNGSTNVVKNPYYQIIENLQTSIIFTCRELGLTPAGLKKINSDAFEEIEESGLEKALKDLENG